MGFNWLNNSKEKQTYNLFTVCLFGGQAGVWGQFNGGQSNGC